MLLCKECGKKFSIFNFVLGHGLCAKCFDQEQMSQKYQSWSMEQLAKAISEGAVAYRPEAIEAIKQELIKRSKSETEQQSVGGNNRKVAIEGKRSGLQKTVLIITVLITAVVVGVSMIQRMQKDLYTEVSIQINRLVASDSLNRAGAAFELGLLGRKANCAIPYLFNVLNDSSPLVWTSCPGGTCPGVEGTSPSEEASKALLRITGQDFGSNKQKWEDWWKINAKKYPCVKRFDFQYILK
jgi:hypothetical protein